MTVAQTGTETSGTAPGNFVRENFVWLLGLIPVILAAIKILLVSGGDPQVFNYLLKNLNVIALILSIVLPLVPLITFWMFVVYIDRRFAKPKSERPEVPFWRLQVLNFVALGAVASMSMVFAIASGFAVVFALLIRWYRRRRDKKRSVEVRSHSPMQIVHFTPMIIVISIQLFFGSAVSWISTEAIKFKDLNNQAVEKTAQVIEVGNPYATLLLQPREIRIVETKNIVSREPCVLDNSIISGTVGQRLGQLLNSKIPRARLCPRTK